jgi:hypothetical protein
MCNDCMWCVCHLCHPGDAADAPATYTMQPSTIQQQHCLAFSYASVDAQGRAVEARE